MVTCNVIQSEPERFVAYFDEFPDIIAQGSSEDDVKERLILATQSIKSIKIDETKIILNTTTGR